MKLNTVYRLTISGDIGLRQYHLHSRRVVEVYLQTYLALGKQIDLEQLVDGIWEPAYI